MNTKVLCLICVINTSSYSEIKNEKYDNEIVNKKVIILKPKKDIVKVEDINCSYGNYMDCAEKKYGRIEGEGFFDKVITVFSGKEKTVKEEEVEEDTTIGEDISNFGSSIWIGTKGLASDAGTSTKNFIKRKFDESWEDAKKEMEENRKSQRIAKEKATGKYKE